MNRRTSFNALRDILLWEKEREMLMQYKSTSYFGRRVLRLRNLPEEKSKELVRQMKVIMPLERMTSCDNEVCFYVPIQLKEFVKNEILGVLNKTLFEHKNDVSSSGSDDTETYTPPSTSPSSSSYGEDDIEVTSSLVLITNISQKLKESQLDNFIRGFGRTLTKFQFFRWNGVEHSKYGWVVFEDIQSAEQCAKSLSETTLDKTYMSCSLLPDNVTSEADLVKGIKTVQVEGFPDDMKSDDEIRRLIESSCLELSNKIKYIRTKTVEFHNKCRGRCIALVDWRTHDDAVKYFQLINEMNENTLSCSFVLPGTTALSDIFKCLDDSTGREFTCENPSVTNKVDVTRNLVRSNGNAQAPPPPISRDNQKQDKQKPASNINQQRPKLPSYSEAISTERNSPPPAYHSIPPLHQSVPQGTTFVRLPSQPLTTPHVYAQPNAAILPTPLFPCQPPQQQSATTPVVNNQLFVNIQQPMVATPITFACAANNGQQQQQQQNRGCSQQHSQQPAQQQQQKGSAIKKTINNKQHYQKLQNRQQLKQQAILNNLTGDKETIIVSKLLDKDESINVPSSEGNTTKEPKKVTTEEQNISKEDKQVINNGKNKDEIKQAQQFQLEKEQKNQERQEDKTDRPEKHQQQQNQEKLLQSPIPQQQQPNLPPSQNIKPPPGFTPPMSKSQKRKLKKNRKKLFELAKALEASEEKESNTHTDSNVSPDNENSDHNKNGCNNESINNISNDNNSRDNAAQNSVCAINSNNNNENESINISNDQNNKDGSNNHIENSKELSSGGDTCNEIKNIEMSVDNKESSIKSTVSGNQHKKTKATCYEDDTLAQKQKEGNEHITSEAIKKDCKIGSSDRENKSPDVNYSSSKNKNESMKQAEKSPLTTSKKTFKKEVLSSEPSNVLKNKEQSSTLTPREKEKLETTSRKITSEDKPKTSPSQKETTTILKTNDSKVYDDKISERSTKMSPKLHTIKEDCKQKKKSKEIAEQEEMHESTTSNTQNNTQQQQQQQQQQQKEQQLQKQKKLPKTKNNFSDENNTTGNKNALKNEEKEEETNQTIQVTIMSQTQSMGKREDLSNQTKKNDIKDTSESITVPSNNDFSTNNSERKNKKSNHDNDTNHKNNNVVQSKEALTTMGMRDGVCENEHGEPPSKSLLISSKTKSLMNQIHNNQSHNKDTNEKSIPGDTKERNIQNINTEAEEMKSIPDGEKATATTCRTAKLTTEMPVDVTHKDEDGSAEKTNSPTPTITPNGNSRKLSPSSTSVNKKTNNKSPDFLKEELKLPILETIESCPGEEDSNKMLERGPKIKSPQMKGNNDIGREVFEETSHDLKTSNENEEITMSNQSESVVITNDERILEKDLNIVKEWNTEKKMINLVEFTTQEEMESDVRIDIFQEENTHHEDKMKVIDRNNVECPKHICDGQHEEKIDVEIQEGRTDRSKTPISGEEIKPGQQQMRQKSTHYGQSFSQGSLTKALKICQKRSRLLPLMDAGENNKNSNFEKTGVNLSSFTASTRKLMQKFFDI